MDFKTQRSIGYLRAALMGGALTVSIYSSPLWALGLGNIQVNSTLNHRLDANIDLVDVTPETLPGVSVKLAPVNVYQRLGIERLDLLERLQFSVETLESGQHVIHVTTQEPLQEPFLNFLIQVDWSGGQVMREFTVLLDPPVFGEEQVSPVEAPSVISSRRAQETTPGVIQPPAIKQQQTLITPEVQQQVLEYGPVQRNEILWDIAKKMRPQGISTQQMMLALLRENPDAFFGNNINMLKEGAVLRIQNVDAVQSRSVQQAILEVARQNEQWLANRRQQKAERAVAAESLGTELQGAPKVEPPVVSTTPQAPVKHLELVVPDELPDEGSPTTAATQEAERELAELGAQLDSATDAVEAARKDNAELQNRLATLQDQVMVMQSLIALKDRELETLRASSGQVPEQTGEQGQPLVELQTLEERSNQALGGSVDVEGENKTPPNMWRDPVVIGTLFGVLLLLGLLLWLLMRGRNKNQSLEELDSHISEFEMEDNVELLNEEDSEQVGVEPLTDMMATEYMAPEAEGYAARDLDPITEADLYIAYEKYDKAEELLRQSFADRTEEEQLKYKLKLLEVLSLDGKVEEFEEEAEELYAAVNGDETHPLWKQVLRYADGLSTANPIFHHGVEKTEPVQDAFGDEPEPLPSIDDELSTTELVHEYESAASMMDEKQTSVSEPEEIVQEAGVGETVYREEKESTPVDEEHQAEDEDINAIRQAFEDEGLNDWQDEVAVDVNNEQDESSTFLLEDEIGSKLDLARAYIEMEDYRHAKKALQDVLDKGTEKQIIQAEELMKKLETLH